MPSRKTTSRAGRRARQRAPASPAGTPAAGRRSRPAPHGDEAGDRHHEILERAAQLFCERGYEGTSIQQIADACGLTKAGLYHHIRSKEHLLLEIQHYGMDIFERQVLSEVLPISDPLERLESCMEKNVLLVTRARSKEVTVILHEHATLTGEAQVQVNARKKRYVRFLESSFTEAMRDGRIRPVHPKVAAFAFLGMVNWIYKWYRTDGEIAADELAREMRQLFFGGLERPVSDRRPGPRKAARGERGKGR